jgi:HEAT repeat protein
MTNILPLLLWLPLLIDSALGRLPDDFETAMHKADLRYLAEAGLATDDGALLAYLRGRDQAGVDQARVGRLLRELGDDDFQTRENAERELVKLGVAALPALQKAADSAQPELARRAKACVEQLERQQDADLPLLAVRVLVKRRAAAAAQVLLRYLPAAEGEATEDEIAFGLEKLARGAPATVSLLARALDDASAKRRAVAACIVTRRGTPDERHAARRLLADASPLVRLRAAQGLLTAGEKDGIPVLIRLLEEAPLEIAWQAEELLQWVAGADDIEPIVGAGEAAVRKTCRHAWEEWYRRAGPGLDPKGCVQVGWRPRLVMTYGFGDKDRAIRPETRLYGCRGRPHWHSADYGSAFDTWSGPHPVQVLAGPRLLWLENDGVTERDVHGKVLWYQAFPGIEACQRLANGNTFFARPNAFGETRRDRTVVYVHKAARDQLADYRGMRSFGNGRLFWLREELLDNWEASIIDVGTFKVKGRADLPFVVEQCERDMILQPGGRCLLPIRMHEPPEDRWQALVYKSGELLWRGSPNSGGIPLTGSTFLHAGNGDAYQVGRLVELDLAGTPLWEVLTAGMPWVNLPCLHQVRLGFGDLCEQTTDPAIQRQRRIALLESPDRVTRLAGIHGLRLLGPMAAQAVPPLIKTLKDPDEELASRALSALNEVGPAALPTLIHALADPDHKVRWGIAAVLGGTGFANHADLAIPALLKAACDDFADVRGMALGSLGSMSTHASVVVPALARGLMDDPDVQVRKYAGSALCRLLPHSQAAIPHIAKCMEGIDADLRDSILRDLRLHMARKRPIIPALTEALGNQQCPDTRLAATQILSQLGDEGRAAVPALLRVLDDRRRDPSRKWAMLRLRVCETLWTISRDGKPLTPVLCSVANDEKVEVELRAKAIEALATLGAAAGSTIPLLESLAKSPYKEIRGPAKQALLKLRKRP